ncbi:glycine betaine/proline transport system permease protein [Azospirillum oryzae]|uniref:Glycine betaine/proline transport system permease protein n=1 Tax=Azospirillum oryzae TaxID=286727 RepID=A0A1X7FAJ8_9PROT|nr:proline/glycine betaine ABC transporter permease [Azospirillum oryzae]SMF49154.1 glycine betaine/proline transport system permease protein [Azospirillum oryzae]
MDFKLPFGDWAEAVVLFLLDHAQWLFDGIDVAIGAVADGVQTALTSLPGVVLAGLVVLIGLWRVGWRFGLFAALSLLVVAGLGMWNQMVDTLALVLTATTVALILGIPVGIWSARNDRIEAVVRPVLDLMQTMPAFVYLIPAAMLFGLGRVPGTIATIIFSMPPVVRLTSLGIRQVPHELVEAGLAFGCTPRQLLVRVQMPTALPSIMAGINQTIMLSLSMVVIASMIGAGGLGNEVLRGIQRLDIGQGFEGGLAVVILAVLLDRITQSFGNRKPEDRKSRLSWSALAARRKAGAEKSSLADGAIEAG